MRLINHIKPASCSCDDSINLWSKGHGSSAEPQLLQTHKSPPSPSPIALLYPTQTGCISLMQHVRPLMIMRTITFKLLFIHFTPRFHSARSLIDYNLMKVAFQCSFSRFFSFLWIKARGVEGAMIIMISDLCPLVQLLEVGRFDVLFS